MMFFLHLILHKLITRSVFHLDFEWWRIRLALHKPVCFSFSSFLGGSFITSFNCSFSSSSSSSSSSSVRGLISLKLLLSLFCLFPFLPNSTRSSPRVPWLGLGIRLGCRPDLQERRWLTEHFHNFRASKSIDRRVSCSSKPDEPFHNFRASRSGDQRVLCTSRTSCYGFWSSKIVKGFVGRGWSTNLEALNYSIYYIGVVVIEYNIHNM